MTDWAGVVFGGLALVVAVASLTVAYAAERRTRNPVLVFVFVAEGRAEEGGHEGAWHLRNVGLAPAHNVVVAESAEPINLRAGIHEDWRNPVLVPAIASGAAQLLSWLRMSPADGLGASYTDAHGRYHTTECGGDVSFVFPGLHIPRWPMTELLDGRRVVRPLWQVDRELPAEWSRVNWATAPRSRWLPRRWGVCRRLGGRLDPVRAYSVALQKPL